MRNGAFDVAEVDFPELVHFGEGADGFENIFSHFVAAFEPGSAAETDADIGAVGGFEGAEVAVEIAEDAARHASELGHRRIIGMNADADAEFFSHRYDLTDEVRVIFPQFLFAEFSAMGERRFENFPGPI